jgi:hypothetical protein
MGAVLRIRDGRKKNPDLGRTSWIRYTATLKFIVADPDPGSGAYLTLEILDGKIRIRDKHTGSATLYGCKAKRRKEKQHVYITGKLALLIPYSHIDKLNTVK